MPAPNIIKLLVQWFDKQKDIKKLFGRFLRWYSVKLYIRRGLARDKRNNEKKLLAANLSGQKKLHYERELNEGLRGWDAWLWEVEDAEMIERAKKMDILLEDLPLLGFDKDDYSHKPHYCQGYDNEFGRNILNDESRTALRKAMSERMPAYRKERREYWELWLKAGALVMGIIGTATGFIATLKH